ncbi:MAG TPA: zinc ribbon domain-containing protein, partial [Pirellulales bacterium]
MNGMLGLLCTAGFVLGIVTVVGHGIWVVLAKLFTAESLDPNDFAPAAEGRCPACHAVLPGSRRLCPACGWPLRESANAPAGVGLDAVLRELQRLERARLLDPATAARLAEAVRAEQVRPATAPLSLATPAPPAEPAAPKEPAGLELPTLTPDRRTEPETPAATPVETPYE